jgi:hypothetical protein
MMMMNELNGFNPDFLKEDKNVPDKVEAIGVKALFLNNCNLMLLIIIVEVAAAGILYLIGYFMKSFSEKLSSISKYMVKEVLLTLMMFNAFNIAFGVGIHFTYADKGHESYAVSSLAAVVATSLIFATCLLLTFAEAKQFGEFKDKLKRNLVCQLYFVVSLVYRFTLGYYIAVKTEYTLSSLMIVGISMVFVGYNFINLPFRDAYHNYRACVCHLAQLVILFVSNYYDSMTENEPLKDKSHNFTGAKF